VADAEVLPTATAMARQFLENSWFTLRMDKQLINGGLDHTLQAGLAFERATSPGSGPDTAQRLGGFAKT
jgi:enoyl-CoA hydratase/carnithine racemase